MPLTPLDLDLKLSFNLFRKLPASEKRITLATIFTLARIASVPFIVAAMVYQYWGVAFTLIIFSSITALVDGFLARNFGQKSFLGACLDPIADKLLILSCYFTLAFSQSPLFTIPGWFVWLVLFKELLLLGFAVTIWKIKGFLKVEPTLLGKLTMTVQVVFIVWLFACYFFHWVPIRTYYFMLGLVLLLVLSSLIQYATIGYRYFYSSFSVEN